MGTKRMTRREKEARAQAKRRLQKEGIIPPDKPRLNRKRFLQEARDEYDARDKDWSDSAYLSEALAWVMAHPGKNGTISPEAVGAAKVLKVAVRLGRFYREVRERGGSRYKVSEKYEYIRDILEA